MLIEYDEQKRADHIRTADKVADTRTAAEQ